MFTPLNIPLKDIESVTNKFSEANFIGEGFLGKIYQGQLSVSGELIDVAVRRLDHSFWLQDIAFDKEISILSSLKHENLVSNVGFCNEKDEMIIINKREARGSLNRNLSNPQLTWMKRLKISVGVASVLSYLHNLKPRSVVHHNVNGYSILLDEKWEAKLSGFEYSMIIPAARDLDVAYEKLGIGTYKSDMFSFGIVLFEILCGAKAFIANDGSFQASFAIFQHENRKLHELVDPDLFSHMDPQSFNIFSETACYCLREQHAPPDMNRVLKRLDRAFKLQQKHENPELSAVVAERILSPHLKLKLKNLEHMRVQLSDIMLATENFASKYCIVSGGYGTVYKAELYHVDKEYCCAIEKESEHELPKTRSKVAIKRIYNTDESGEQGFYTEIEMLTKCKHSNVLTLLGFCDEGSSMILIYEYATYGSLADYLQNKSKITNDSWAQRLKICIDAAKGLSCLHIGDGDRQEIVHRDIKSANILLGMNLEAKIGDFGLSKFFSAYEEQSDVAGTGVYIDPQYVQEARLKKEIDVYSFGVVLFEILCGTVAYDPIYSVKNNKGLARVAQQHVYNRTIMDILDPKIKDGESKTFFKSIKGPDQDSVDIFSRIAYRCLDGRQDNRPTMEAVINELEKAAFFHENRKDIFQAPLNFIKSVTDNFSLDYFIKREGFWDLYSTDVSFTNIDMKRLDTSHPKTLDAFSTELKILMDYKHENVISLVGYCDEVDEKIIVYEHPSSGTLDSSMNDGHLTWAKYIEISIDIASALAFLHGGVTADEMVIHGDIKSSNLQLDGKMKAKIAGFGHSIICLKNQEMEFPVDVISGTSSYIEPHYARTGLLSLECDIYSFGMVLFEIMFRSLAYARELDVHDGYLGPVIEKLYKEKKLDKIVFTGKYEEISPQSVAVFQRVAFQCLHEKRKERPTAREVVIQLKEALEIQEKGMDIVRLLFEDIKSATDNFSDNSLIREGASGRLYKGLLQHADGQKIIAVKQLDTANGQGNIKFYQELEVLSKFKHKNVVSLVGYHDESSKRFIVYDYESKGSLDRWLNNVKLTWMKRLEICVDIATGLDFLHGGFLRQKVVVHGDIKSGHVLLTEDWKVKITGFGVSFISPINHGLHYLDDGKFSEAARTLDRYDPLYLYPLTPSKITDLYSFGVVLFEILYGEHAYEILKDIHHFLDTKSEDVVDERVFEGIKGQIGPQSFVTFSRIAYQCINIYREDRLTASKVLVQLKKALEFQEDFEIWEPKLPTDYKQIIQMSQSPEINFNKKKKDLYNMFCEGILLRGGKVLLSFDKNGIRNEILSAKMFSYKDQKWQKWKRIRESRFHRVAMMLDPSNLMIEFRFNKKTQFLSPNVIYGVHLIFKFGDSEKVASKLMYFNLKYKRGNERMHAYFAKQREDKWMTIELFRFSNIEKVTEFEVLLESFSQYYCGNGVIYVEGIEFRAIGDVNQEGGKLKELEQISSSNFGQLQQLPTAAETARAIPENSEESEKLSEVDRMKIYMLSAEDVLYDSSNVKLFMFKTSEQSRFGKVIELRLQQVFRIKCKIDIQMLSPNTDYTCYLIFKLSEKCGGLHCPVKVRNLLQRNNKQIGTLYFRSPTPWNLHDIKQVPKQREDEWMEVGIWKFNSNVDLKNGCVPINLKLICYEGTMAGLIICGVEFRPL